MPVGRVDATIIICTCNRAENLEGTLDAIGKCDLAPELSIELLVVDNGSTDGTRKVVDSFKTDRLIVNYLFEPKRGKGNAYNAGIEAALGEILIFTDDDVRPAAGWLIEHIKEYQKPDVSAVQGRIELEFSSPPPDWMEAVHRGLLAETDMGPDVLFPYLKHLVGANMSFRKEAARATGPFCTLLGPGSSGFFDESEFSERLMKKGFLQLYQPAASVRHLIPASRLDFAYFQDAAYRHGVSSYIAGAIGTLPMDPNPILSIIRASLRQVKLRLKALIRGERYEGTQDDLFYRMHIGASLASIKGLSRLKRKYQP